MPGVDSAWPTWKSTDFTPQSRCSTLHPGRHRGRQKGGVCDVYPGWREREYIQVRDFAALLNGTAAQFEVGWDGKVALTAKRPYTGSTDKAPFNTEMPYTVYAEPTHVNGKAVDLNAIQIECNGGGFTYYKLRDLAQALGFNVGWSAETGVYVETTKPYDPNN